MIVQMDKTPNSTSKERAQQLYNKNIELEKKRQKSLQAKIPSDPNTWYQIRENYEAIILEDYTFAEKHNVEFSLWQLHYKRIEEFRGLYSSAQASGRSANTSGRAPVHPERISKIRGQFKAFLSEATGFYHDLILKIKAKYGLPLGHFTEDFDNEAVMGTENAKSSDAKKALVSCHRCLIYLGDLARYKGLYGEGEARLREFSAASSYYMQAAFLWPSNGNPHHQLAILSTYSNDELVAVYRYFRSLAVEVPFATAKENLLIAFEKNRQSYTHLIEATKTTGSREDSIKQKYKEFCTQFVRLHGILFTRTSLETFATVLSSVRGTFLELLSSGAEESLKFGKDITENGIFFVRLVAILIFTVFNASKKNEGQSYAEILQHNLLCENTRSLTFEVMSLIVERSVQLLDPSSSFLLPGILVFLEWLASSPDFTANTSSEKKQSAAESSFWKHSIALFNKLLSSHLGAVDDGDETCFTNMSRYVEGETGNRLALSEDFELRGFLPLLPAQSILDFSRKQSISLGGNNKENRYRVKRIIAAGRALASIASVDHKPVSFDSKAKQFVIGVQLQAFDNRIPSSYVGPTEPHSTEKEEIVASSVESMIRNNVRLSFEGDDEGEEIVFRPAFSEKQIDVGTAWVFPDESKQGRNTPPVSDVHYQQVTSGHVPPSAIAAAQRHPVRDVPNSPRLIEQQTSLADRINSLRFVENNHELKYESKGSSGVSDGGSYVFPQPSVSLMNTAIVYSDYKRAPGPMLPPKMDFFTFSEGLADMGVKPSSLTSAASKSQSGRPIRRLGPPPGFSAVPPKHVSMPMSSVAGTNGSLVVDDYSWLDGYHMPSSSSIVPNHVSVGGVSLGNSHLGYMSSSNGNSGLPFPGMQSSSVQLQGGNLNSYSEYQSFRNMNPNHGHKLLEQQHVMTGNHQFTTQEEHYQVQSAWNGQYRV